MIGTGPKLNKSYIEVEDLVPETCSITEKGANEKFSFVLKASHSLVS